MIHLILITHVDPFLLILVLLLIQSHFLSSETLTDCSSANKTLSDHFCQVKIIF